MDKGGRFAGRSKDGDAKARKHDKKGSRRKTELIEQCEYCKLRCEDR